jgi:hypothetical protein
LHGRDSKRSGCVRALCAHHLFPAAQPRTDGLLREQPQRVQQQLSELSQQMQVVQARAAAKEASSRKYKEAVRAFKVRRGACVGVRKCTMGAEGTGLLAAWSTAGDAACVSASHATGEAAGA